MLSPEFAQLVAMALAGIAVGGIVYVLVMPYMSGERKASERVGNVAQGSEDSCRGTTIPANT